MKRALLLGTLLILLLTFAPMVAAQNSSVEIASPLPVSELWGRIDIVGTADVPNMQYYFIEYVPLNTDLTIPSGSPWIPATVALTRRVRNDVLATINTRQLPDGVYGLRLSVATRDGVFFQDVVTPLRVSNDRFDRIIEQIVDDTLQQYGISTPEPPTPIPPTATPFDPTPRVNLSANINAGNIRRCDVVDNYSCAVQGILRNDQTARVLAISANGTGWYQVRLPSGVIGWISPTIVDRSGNFSGLPFVAPPEPLPPPQPNVLPNGMSIQNNRAVCNEAFNVLINVANVGNATAQPGIVTLQDINVRTGDITFTGEGNFPSIEPGQNFVVVIPVRTAAFYNEQHELRARTGDDQFTLRYTLGQGNCNVIRDNDNDNVPNNQDQCPNDAGPANNNGCPEEPERSRDFSRNECILFVTEEIPYFDVPEGPRTGRTLSPDELQAISVRLISGNTWYKARFEQNRQVWFRERQIEAFIGNCSLEGGDDDRPANDNIGAQPDPDFDEDETNNDVTPDNVDRQFNSNECILVFNEVVDYFNVAQGARIGEIDDGARISAREARWRPTTGLWYRMRVNGEDAWIQRRGNDIEFRGDCGVETGDGAEAQLAAQPSNSPQTTQRRFGNNDLCVLIFEEDVPYYDSVEGTEVGLADAGGEAVAQVVRLTEDSGLWYRTDMQDDNNRNVWIQRRGNDIAFFGDCGINN